MSFIFVAADGYKVVFSWNEIFNTDIGNSLYLITEMNGKKINEMDERILFLSTGDFKTGRRFITGLDKIIAKRADYYWQPLIEQTARPETGGVRFSHYPSILRNGSLSC